MVASTIGVIAMTGMAKHAALIAQQQRQINKERELNAFWEQFGTETNCKETIKGWLNQNTAPNYPAPTSAQKAKLAEGTEGNEIEIKIIKKSASSNLLDVHDTTNIFRRYGFTPRFFVLRCNPADNGGSCDCKASGTTYPCKKTWMLIPGVQRGMTFIRGKLLTLDISWPAAPNSAYDNFTCSKIGISGGKNRCYKAEATGSKRTLAGCGSTQSLGGTGTTAFGNDAGLSATITGSENNFFGKGVGGSATVAGHYNTFLGFAGYRAKVDGTYNNFYGNQAGRESTVAGGHNLFIGYYAGNKATVSGDGNHFVGRQTGHQATLAGSASHFFGNQAGYKTTVTSGSSNTFVGTNAGREATISAGGNHFFGDNAGHKATVSGGQNHFVGYHAGDSATVAGTGNTFIGKEAGKEADIQSGADGNVFIGHHSGIKKATGQTQNGNISGDVNVILGHASGRRATVSGSHNTLLGTATGEGATISGNGNTFLGSYAGSNQSFSRSGGTYIRGNQINLRSPRSQTHDGIFLNADKKIEIKAPDVKIKAQGWLCPAGQVLQGFRPDGHKVCVTAGPSSGYCPAGKYLRGFDSSGNRICSGYTATGFGATYTDYDDVGHTNWRSTTTVRTSISRAGYTVVGVRLTKQESPHDRNGHQGLCEDFVSWKFDSSNITTWKGCRGDFRVYYEKNVPSSGASSKVYKKNIRPFNDMEKALKDILETPLFTYYFKDKNNFPKKKRMGVIAEDLPKNLQLKGKPIAPDWPSIYGTLWAGIKALHSKFKTLNSTIEAKFKALSKTDDQFKKELAGTNKELANTKQELKSANEKIDSLSKELKELKSSFEKTGLRDPDKQPIR